MSDFNSPIPADDLQRTFTLARPDDDQSLPHYGIVGDTYTFLVTGDQTAGKFCLIDMHIPPGGGPAPHRHDFEETFAVIQGQIEATFRGHKLTVKAGETLNIPANAPHEFRNQSAGDVRLLCWCAPSGQEEFFAQVGVPVATRTTAPPPMSDAEQKRSSPKRRSWRRSIAPSFCRTPTEFEWNRRLSSILTLDASVLVVQALARLEPRTRAKS